MQRAKNQNPGGRPSKPLLEHKKPLKKKQKIIKKFMECQHLIFEGLRLGLTRKLAIEHSGISEKYFYEVMNEAEKMILSGNYEMEDPYIVFYDGIRKAQSDCAKERLKEIIEAAKEKKDWRASAWMLERIYPSDYGPKVHVTPQEPKEPFRFVFNLSGTDINVTKAVDDESE